MDHIKALPDNIRNPPHRNSLSDLWKHLQEWDTWKSRLEDAERMTKAEYALLNKPSPDWSAKDATGQVRALKDYRGKVLVLDFWGCGCGPCLLAMPYLNQLEAIYADKPVVFLGMNVGDSEEDVRTKIDEMKLRNIQILFGANSRLYNVSAIPVFVVIDPEGVVRYQKVGWDDDEKIPLRAEIDRLLNKAD
jgi:thiol-disulfide isomerase/thioredoxin